MHQMADIQSQKLGVEQIVKREVKKQISKKKEPEMMITEDLSQDEFEFVV